MALIVIIAVIYAAFDMLIFKKLDLQYQQLQTQQQQLIDNQQLLSSELLDNKVKLAHNQRSSDQLKQEVNKAQLMLKDTETQLNLVFEQTCSPNKNNRAITKLIIKNQWVKTDFS
ncbi:MAG: hypothetical protein Q9N32_03800 [Gammaproteobacteria bacterium]|nr:hypothetical protein [Gammaproteobacteria bacterium]